MQLITEEYRRLNADLHKSNHKYGVSGERHAASIFDLAIKMGTQDILDYGCGKSSLANNLPYVIQQYDPAIPKYADLPKPADIVVCTDVLEHIEPACIDKVLAHLAMLTKKVGYLTASTVEAKKTLSDGRNAHLIVQPAKWWINKIYEHFEIVNFSKQDIEILVMVQPQK
jgi:hypothetical protein